MPAALILGGTVANEVMIIGLSIASLVTIWFLITAVKFIRRMRQGARMREALQEYKQILDRGISQLPLISEAESSARSAPDRWSKKEILGHLIDSASNNHQRFVRAQMSSEIKLPGYEQEAWVATQRYQSVSWENLLQLWKAYNTHLLHVVSGVPDERLKGLCFIGEHPPVTLEYLIQEYITHLKHHLDQILS